MAQDEHAHWPSSLMCMADGQCLWSVCDKPNPDFLGCHKRQRDLEVEDSHQEWVTSAYR